MRYYKKSLPKIEAIISFINEQKEVTVRQLFYHLVVKGLVKNTHSQYVTLSEFLNKLRYDGKIPFDSLSDCTGFYGTTQFNSLKDMVNYHKDRYRSNWDGEFEDHIEVWLEKEALSDVVHQITNRFGVFLSVSGGRTKVSQVHNFIKRMNYHNKPSVILYLGDFDPTGLNIDENLRVQFEKQSLFIKDLPPTIKRIALTEDQLSNLPKSYQTAKPKDPNYKQFVEKYGKQVWELDALTPKQLQSIIYNELVKYRSKEKIDGLKERDRIEVKEIWGKFESLTK
jgi:hypothetical protein